MPGTGDGSGTIGPELRDSPLLRRERLRQLVNQIRLLVERGAGLLRVCRWRTRVTVVRPGERQGADGCSPERLQRHLPGRGRHPQPRSGRRRVRRGEIRQVAFVAAVVS